MEGAIIIVKGAEREKERDGKELSELSTAPIGAGVVYKKKKNTFVTLSIHRERKRRIKFQQAEDCILYNQATFCLALVAFE